jgi:hypothetical protein
MISSFIKYNFAAISLRDWGFGVLGFWGLGFRV